MRDRIAFGQFKCKHAYRAAVAFCLSALLVFGFQNCGPGYSPLLIGPVPTTAASVSTSTPVPTASPLPVAPTPTPSALPEEPALSVSGYGFVRFAAGNMNSVVALSTTLTVPAKPDPIGTVFLWPGLQPFGENFLPIDNGVLQPVLTWGLSCAPGGQPAAYSTWWVSAQYVNTVGHLDGFTGCQGGAVMAVAPGDRLNMDMTLNDQVWTQTITDLETSKSVSFPINLRKQAQTFSEFVIEDYSNGAPKSPVQFSNTRITYASSDPANCVLQLRGTNDYVSSVNTESGGQSCFIPSIILRSEGLTGL